MKGRNWSPIIVTTPFHVVVITASVILIISRRRRRESRSRRRIKILQTKKLRSNAIGSENLELNQIRE